MKWTSCILVMLQSLLAKHDTVCNLWHVGLFHVPYPYAGKTDKTLFPLLHKVGIYDVFKALPFSESLKVMHFVLKKELPINLVH